ncbi:hypothetical protein D3C76_1384810 [compost metagenome]
MEASAEVNSSAAPTPLMARAMSRNSAFGAAPQPIDARMKMPSPHISIFCRPKRSARLPAGSNSAAKASI